MSFTPARRLLGSFTNPIFLWGGVVALVAACVAFGSVFTQARAASEFKTTTGTVVSGEVVVIKGEDQTFEPRLKYRFKVDQKPFSGDKIRFGTFSMTERSQPPNSDIVVKYDPKDPTLNLVGQPGAHFVPELMMLGVPSIFFCLRAPRNFDRKPRAGPAVAQ